MSDAPLIQDLFPQALAGRSDPDAVAAAITARSGSSFSAGMSILARPRRTAMRAVYAFCRVVDDIADGDFPTSAKLDGLNAWREEMDRLYAGTPVSAIGQALIAPVEAHDLPQREFLLMIEGMEMDARGPLIAPSSERLGAYTRRVAGSVGSLSMRIFGAWKGEVSERFALALGDAFQLTNILRDVEEDAETGRVYLPRELLETHGVALLPGCVAGAPGLPGVCRDLGEQARAHYDTARGLAGAHDRARLRPALLMMGAYEAYLDRMEALDWQRSPHGVALSKRAKLARGLRYAVMGPGRAARARQA